MARGKRKAKHKRQHPQQQQQLQQQQSNEPVAITRSVDAPDQQAADHAHERDIRSGRRDIGNTITTEQPPIVVVAASVVPDTSSSVSRDTNRSRPNSPNSPNHTQQHIRILATHTSNDPSSSSDSSSSSAVIPTVATTAAIPISDSAPAVPSSASPSVSERRTLTEADTRTAATSSSLSRPSTKHAHIHRPTRNRPFNAVRAVSTHPRSHSTDANNHNNNNNNNNNSHYYYYYYTPFNTHSHSHSHSQSPFQRAHFNIACIRIILFSLLIYEYATHMPHYQVLDVAHPSCYDTNDSSYNFQDESMFLDTGSDTWLANDWYEWLQHYVLPRLPYAGKASKKQPHLIHLFSELFNSLSKPQSRDSVNGNIVLQFQFHLWYIGGIVLGALALYRGGIQVLIASFVPSSRTASSASATLSPSASLWPWQKPVSWLSQRSNFSRNKRLSQRRLEQPVTGIRQQLAQLLPYYYYTLSATLFLLMYACKLFSLFHLYTDYHYLLLCMGFLVTFLDQSDIDGTREWNTDIKHQQQIYTGLFSWLWNVLILDRTVLSTAASSPSSPTATNSTNNDNHSRSSRRKRSSINSQPQPALPEKYRYQSSLHSWSTTTVNLLRFQLAIVFAINSILHRLLDEPSFNGEQLRLRTVVKNLKRMYEHYREQQLRMADPSSRPSADPMPKTPPVLTVATSSVGSDDEPFRHKDNYVFPLYPFTIPNTTETPYDNVRYSTIEGWKHLHHHPIATPYSPSMNLERFTDELARQGQENQERLNHRHGRAYHPMQVQPDVYAAYDVADRQTVIVYFVFSALLAVRLWLGSHRRWWFVTILESTKMRSGTPSLSAELTVDDHGASNIDRSQNHDPHDVGTHGYFQSWTDYILTRPWYTWTVHAMFAIGMCGYIGNVAVYWDSDYNPPYQLSFVYIAIGFWAWRSYSQSMEVSLVRWIFDVLWTLLVEPFLSNGIPADLKAAKSIEPSSGSGDENGTSSLTTVDIQRQRLLEQSYMQMKSRKRWYAFVSLCWVLFQVAMPLRTVIASRWVEAHISYTRRGYIWAGLANRYAWTQWMGPQRNSIITHTGSFIREAEDDPTSMDNSDPTCTDGSDTCEADPTASTAAPASGTRRKMELVHKTAQLRLGYLVGTCRGHGKMIQSEYMVTTPIDENLKNDDGTYTHNQLWKEIDLRTLPAQTMLNKGQWEGFERYPRQWARLGSGLARALETVCSDLQLDVYNYPTYEDAFVHGVLFQQLNGRGAFSRILDPTMDLEQVDQARRKIQSLSQIFLSWEAASDWFKAMFMDQVPRRYESILRGIGTIRDVSIESGEPYLWEEYPHAKAVYVISDRVECLREAPVLLWPNEYPITLAALVVPYGYRLYFRGQRRQKDYRNQPGFKPVNDSSTGREVSEFETFWTSQMGPNSEKIPLRRFDDRKVVTTSLEVGIDIVPDQMAEENATKYKCHDTTFEDVMWGIVFES